MKKFVYALALLTVIPIWVLGQRSVFQNFDSYEKGLSIVRKSIRALGLNDLSDLKTINFEFEGNVYWRHQGHELFPPYESTPLNARFFYDISNSCIAYESISEAPGGFKNHRRDVREKKGGFTADFYRNGMRDLPNSSPEDLRYVLDRIPHLVLQRIVERPTGIRLVGKIIYKNRPHNVITAAFGNTTASFYFDDSTSFLSKYELLVFDAFEGDVLQERVFDGYRRVDGLMFPSVWQQRVANTLGQEYKYLSVRINSPANEDFFKIPELPKFTNNTRATPNVSEIAPGVFFLEQIAFPYNMLFMEFSDFLVVVEAPVSSEVCGRAIEMIKKQIPNKPIRYIIPTHHHDDHAGGLRAFVAEGATILTTPGNRPFFERMMNARYLSQPDKLAASRVSAKIEVIADKFVVRDGEQTLELHNIGPNPHTDEMLVAYLPNDKLLFQADLWHGLPVNKMAVYFNQWLKGSKLPVRRVYGVHQPGITLEEIESAVSSKRDAN